MSLAPERLAIGITRHFTSPGVHPYDQVEWERRDARITNWKDGSVAFEQPDVEFPTFWSLNATNIVAQKYFRGTIGMPERERSLKQVVDRVADTITAWGVEGGYFVDEGEAESFRDELKFILVTQRAAFNSPVWFNIGVKGVPQQASACFILAVDDTMDGILNWYREEGVIFKGGSGSGINLSNIRSSYELLNGGGTASGPVSFMRGADASAGTIKSGGKTRRAAKMVILNVDHPDVEEFIWCKAKEERKARVLRDAGFDMDLDGVDSFSIQYQNANNSVRVSDEFMAAVENDDEWTFKSVIDGSPVRTVRARDLWHDIAQAAWECADPGLQFDTTINKWHTAHATGRINGSNPCFTADTLVHTDKGLIRFDALLDRARVGESFGVYTHDVTNPEAPANSIELTSPDAFMVTGVNEIVRLEFANGMELRCTAGHRIFTANRGYVEAAQLDADDQVRILDLPTPAVHASWALPIDPTTLTRGDRRVAARINLPEKWTSEFAHYLGWVVGDGSISGDVISSVYGSADDLADVMPAHRLLLAEINGGQLPKPSHQANGTVQLRATRRALADLLRALGVNDAGGAHKAVPTAVNEAPTPIVAAFLRGLFDADGCVYDGEKSRYVGLGSVSKQLLQGVQRLLSTLGVTSAIYNTRASTTDASFAYTTVGGEERVYSSLPMFDLRISSADIARFAAAVGFGVSSKADKLARLLAEHRFYDVDHTTTRLRSRSDDGVELTYNLSEPRNHSYLANGVVVRNCSEYMHIDNSACNLASINLLHYLDEEGRFDVDAYKHTVEVIFTAQEILVGRADYPTEKIGENSRKFRQLGIGYANLGATLMALGLPYDSDDGRAWAAALTSLMTGHAYATSARTASRMGPFAGFADNASYMLDVLRMHRDAHSELATSGAVPSELLAAGRAAWDTAVREGEVYGVRNAQASVLAPTGTIGLMMDCDTTGIEPDLGLVKMKKLVGGGTMTIVNQTIPRALRKLGYTPQQIDEIVAYIDSEKSILGAPHLAGGHVPVFACSMGDNTIHYEGHVRMMGAVQPFISGAISKTVNMPEEASVEDVEALHALSWRLGLKAVAIYRDNCKVGQPLSTAKKDDDAGVPVSAMQVPAVQVVEKVVERIVNQPVRQKLPRTRRARTFEFRVADCKGFANIGEYEDGRPGEIFLTVSKQGSTLSGIMDAFAKSISYGLQYGVPVRAFVEAFVNMRFEPAGMTDDPDIRFASSIMDYLFRRLALEYMTYDERAELGIFSIDERLQPTLPGVEEAVWETRTGSDITPDPKSIPTAEDLIAQIELGIAPEAPNNDITNPGGVQRQLEMTPKPKTRHSDAPMCMQCGVQMVRAGSCHACPSCGSTSGCS